MVSAPQLEGARLLNFEMIGLKPRHTFNSNTESFGVQSGLDRQRTAPVPENDPSQQLLGP
jgi:hypothetical protein